SSAPIARPTWRAPRGPWTAARCRSSSDRPRPRRPPTASTKDGDTACFVRSVLPYGAVGPTGQDAWPRFPDMLRLADDPDDEPAIGLVLAEINRADQHRDPGPVAGSNGATQEAHGAAGELDPEPHLPAAAAGLCRGD